MRMLVALSICIGFWSWAPAASQADFRPGAITEKVVCQADSKQSYALFLPSGYNPQRNWPILYSFDPGGRGRQPVELFKDAAEKYGWIVVGSYNSRNGPGVPLNDIIRALWLDTHERFAIDEKRIYTAGFSGGARVASSFAIAMRDRVAGVIACGAGFPYVKTPTREMRFAYFALAGREDFNLVELHQLEESLTKADVVHQLLTFDGEHSWPSKTLLEEAIAWHEVMSYQKKLRPQDDGRINSLYEQGLRLAQSFETDGRLRLYEAFMRYRILAQSFRGLRATEEAATKFRELQNNKDVQAQINQLKAADRLQESRWSELLNVTQGVKSAETRMQALADGRNFVERMRKQAEADAATMERMVARRLIGQFSVSVSEEANEEMYRKNFSVATTLLTLLTEARPNNPQVFYRLATAQAQSGQKRQALEALSKAVALGFNDVAQLQQAEEFASLRGDKAFRLLIEKIHNN
ncbi:MAG: hypothetical protein J2P21_30935 [Chloracidobacterium sp.]|nr:hypothetical protein [Chloracidobacterium sp.]